MKTESQVRAAFWKDHPQFTPGVKPIPFTQSGQRLYRRKTQNDYPADVRMAFVEYVDDLHRSGRISEKLAQRVTL